MATEIVEDALVASLKLPDGLPPFAKSRWLGVQTLYARWLSCTVSIEWGSNAPYVLQGWWELHQSAPLDAWQVWLEIHPTKYDEFVLAWSKEFNATNTPGKAAALLLELKSQN